MKKFLQWLKDEESGQGMVEYGLIIALISVVAIVAIRAIGGNVLGFFEEAQEATNPVP